MQVSDCNFRVNLYAAGGWAGLSNTDQAAVVNYGREFRAQLQPMRTSGVGHGGFITSCLVHCVSGYGVWAQELIGGDAPSAASLKWLCLIMCMRMCRVWFLSLLAPDCMFLNRYAGNSSAWTVDACEAPPCSPHCVYLRW